MKKLILLAVTTVFLSTAGAALADGHRHKHKHGYHDSHHGKYEKHHRKKHAKRHWKQHWKKHRRHHHRPYFVLRYHWPHHGYGHRKWRHHHAYRPLPIPRVLHHLRRHHYYGFDRVRLRDGRYRVHAYDRHRRPVRLIVDAYTGVIIARHGRY